MRHFRGRGDLPWWAWALLGAFLLVTFSYACHKQQECLRMGMVAVRGTFGYVCVEGRP